MSPTRSITNDQAGRIVKLLIAGMIMQLILVGYVFIQAYDNRVEVVKNQRAACERGKLDRGANAAGWRIAEGARRASGQLEVASQYADIAEGLEERSMIVCSKAFPDARIFP